jgi:hypothetical protein
MNQKSHSSIRRLFSLLKQNESATDVRKQQRGTRFESLEDRFVLTATGFEAPLDVVPEPVALYDTSQVFSNGASLGEVHATADQPTVITAVELKVNGESVTVHSSFDTLRLNQGDKIEVVGVNYEVHDSMKADGVFAGEGYLSSLDDGAAASSVNYSDGRFSLRSTNPAVTVGKGAMSGLDGAWKITEGTDRLSVSLIHYSGDNSERMSTFGIRLQVGDPDFVVDSAVAEQFFGRELVEGEQVAIKGSMLNQGAGRYQNYSEVDVFNAKTGKVEWAGSFGGNVDANNPVSGEYLNTDPNDEFAERWVPTTPGDYVIKFFADPENSWNETNESNNVIEVRITVSNAKTSFSANDDYIVATNKKELKNLDVLANDVGSELRVVDFTQGSTGKVKLNKDGTLRYQPKNNFSGSDEFTYTVVDSHGIKRTAVVKVQVVDKKAAQVQASQANEKAKFVNDAGKAESQLDAKQLKREMRQLKLSLFKEVRNFVKQNRNLNHEVVIKNLPEGLQLKGGDWNGTEWRVTKLRDLKLKISKSFDWQQVSKTGFQLEYKIMSFDKSDKFFETGKSLQFGKEV